MSKAIEQSVKHRLKKIEKETKVPFNRLLETLFLERILTRLAKSKYRDKFIFKGGMCLRQLIELKRETRVLDFLLLGLEKENKKLKAIFEESVQIELDDGFNFNEVRLNPLPLTHKNTLALESKF